MARKLWVCRSRSGNADQEDTTKSGRERAVPMARLLRRALRREWQLPGRDAVYVCPFDASRYAKIEFKQLLREAGLRGYRPKDLRDTYASALFTAGVPLPAIARTLGHSDPTTTTTHYARSIEVNEDVDPMQRLPGEVRADLIARLAAIHAPRGAGTRGRREWSASGIGQG